MTRILRHSADRWAVLAVVASVLMGIYVRLAENYVEPVADAATYVRAASGVTMHPVVDTTLAWSAGSMAMRGVTYPLLIAVLLTVGGSLTFVAWFQSVILVPSTVALLYLTGRRAFSVPVGLMVAWGYALWAPAQIYTSLFMQETWLSFLIALLLYLLTRCITGGGTWSYISTGLLLGVLAITHSAFQFVGLVTLVALLLHRWRYRDGMRWRTALVGAGMVAIVLPSLLIRGAFDLPQQGEGARGYGGGGGWTFWIGSNPDLGFRQPVDGYKFSELGAEGEFAEVLDQVRSGELYADPHLKAIILAKAQSADLQHETLTDADFYRAGVQNLLSEPALLPVKVTSGMAKLLSVPPGLGYYRTGPSTAAPGAPWQFFSYALFVLGGAGILMLAISRRDRLILIVPLAVQASVLILAFPESRHVIPLWGSLFLFAGVAVDAARRALPEVVGARRDAIPALRWAALVTIMGTLVAVTVTTAQPAPAGDLRGARAQMVYDRDTLRRIVLGAADPPAEAIDPPMWRRAVDAPVLPGAARVMQADVPLRFGLHSELLEYIPEVPTGCGLILHGGHGPWADGGGDQVAARALADGCRVIAIDMPAQGRNAGQEAILPTGERLAVETDGLHGAFDILDTPSRTALDVFVLPVIAAVDRMEATTDAPVTVAGLSGGGWTAAVAAAVDDRIARSLNVAGSTVVDSAQPCAGDYEQCLSRLYEAVPMETIYALGASGPGRQSVQVLNYYDPCCFAGDDGSQWATGVQRDVAAAGAGGTYTLIIDRTFPGQHAYQRSATDVLDEWLAQG